MTSTVDARVALILASAARDGARAELDMATAVYTDTERDAPDSPDAREAYTLVERARTELERVSVQYNVVMARYLQTAPAPIADAVDVAARLRSLLAPAHEAA